MRTLAIDIETYSSVDLGKAGVFKYAEAPDFRILLIGYCLDGGPVRVLHGGIWPYEPMNAWEKERASEFLEALMDPSVLKTAFNANFEITCLSRWVGSELDPAEWDCTMIRAATLGLPLTLEGAGKALGLPEDQQKLKTGKELIRYFSKPNRKGERNLPKDAPEKWAEFQKYNAQDVIAEMKIREKILDLSEPRSEHELWCLDQRINRRGVRIDRAMAEGVVEYEEKRKPRLKTYAQELTGLPNPNSVQQLRGWMAEQGIETESLTKDTVSALLKESIPENIKEVLRVRQAMGKTSTKKYQSMLDAVCEDDRVRGLLQFYGSRTGRWAGRLVQVQNLPQNHLEDLDGARSLVKERDFDMLELLYGDPSRVLSELIRTTFIPSGGKMFVVSDFSAIEARVIAWLAGEKWRLDVFRSGGDIYCASASRIYGVPVEKHGVNGHLRQRGKVAELALGYQGGVGAMKRMDTTGSVPEEEMEKIVRDWRHASPKIVRLWRDVEDAAVRAMHDAGHIRTHGITFKRETLDGIRFLIVTLPSGRFISYPNPCIVKGQLTYMGVNQTTKKWERIETYGGKMVENIVQAIARDCLAAAMTRVEAAGYPIVMHVHDEIIVEADQGDLEAVNELMAAPIAWAPGLPLRGDGYVTPYYRKD